MTSAPLIITTAELSELLAADAPVRVLDVRWRLDRPDGRAEYLEAHIPGAVYVDLDGQLASHGEAGDGRHPLPTVEALQASARTWGINDGDTVVVYDNLTGLSAARAWWLLRYAGIADVRLLDGALGAWTAADLPTDAGDVQPDLGGVTLSFGHLPVLEFDDVASFDGVLIDARASERYRGDVEPIDPRAGHIPGAVNAPTASNVDASGELLPVDQIVARYEGLGIADDVPVAVYCGSGVTAAHTVLALAVAGRPAALYPGSWSQWSNHPELEAVTGPNPR